MVYYYTSGNVKTLRTMMKEYGGTDQLSPIEFAEHCQPPWLRDTFLAIQKHYAFLRRVAMHVAVADQLSPEDQDHFVILLYGVIFQIEIKDMELLYKCMFNLSKLLLNTFTNFLGSHEVLDYISRVAQAQYDSRFVTDMIICPLLEWQPHINKLGHNYAKYLKKIESRRLKPLTVPVQPNVLDRKLKHSPVTVSTPAAPPNTNSNQSKKMVTRSAIDLKLKFVHENNKKKALDLLNDVRNKEPRYAEVKSDKYYSTINNIKNEMEDLMKPLPKSKAINLMQKPLPPIKETTATVKRMNERIRLSQKEEVEWLTDVLSCCGNISRIKELEEYDRQEKERERLFDVEKKHLMGQLSYEEAVLAKKKVLEENKKKYDEVLQTKVLWNEEIEKWKKEQMDKKRLQMEKYSLTELNVLQAKNNVKLKKKEIAQEIKKKKDVLRAKFIKVKQDELERRISMIKEIKVLAAIANTAKVPKVIDLTETSGIGLLCEMSIAELQERLSAMKIMLQEELERKKKMIREENLAAKLELEQTKQKIVQFMSEKATGTKARKNKINTVKDTKEISDLKKLLEEKRNLRMKIQAQVQ